MIDNTNPINQFHPYQPVTDVPASERPASGLRGMLNKARSFDVNGSVNRARDWGRQNPGALLGGIAGAAIALGLMRKMR